MYSSEWRQQVPCRVGELSFVQQCQQRVEAVGAVRGGGAGGEGGGG